MTVSSRISSRPAANAARGNAPARRRAPGGAAGGTLVGIFIGLLLGLALAAGVAFYVTGGWRTYQSQLTGSSQAKEAREPARSTKADPDRPRFDFYKILPGNEEPKVQADRKAPEKAADRAVAEKAAERSAGKPAEPAAKSPETAKATSDAERVAKVEAGSRSPAASGRIWLQAGSFASEPDAENLKARLALAGWEASVQQGVLPDKTVRFRVRIGPFDNTDEMNRMKTELGRRGFEVAVIKSER